MAAILLAGTCRAKSVFRIGRRAGCTSGESRGFPSGPGHRSFNQGDPLSPGAGPDFGGRGAGGRGGILGLAGPDQVRGLPGGFVVLRRSTGAGSRSDRATAVLLLVRSARPGGAYDPGNDPAGLRSGPGAVLLASAAAAAPRLCVVPGSPDDHRSRGSRGSVPFGMV